MGYDHLRLTSVTLSLAGILIACVTLYGLLLSVPGPQGWPATLVIFGLFGCIRPGSHASALRSRGSTAVCLFFLYLNLRHVVEGVQIHGLPICAQQVQAGLAFGRVHEPAPSNVACGRVRPTPAIAQIASAQAFPASGTMSTTRPRALPTPCRALSCPQPPPVGSDFLD